MEPDERLTPETPEPNGAAPERRCILTGAHGPRASLIRLAQGPDGTVAPDLGEKLPGRGAWISADRSLLADAAARGRLAGALARAFRGQVKVPDDLAMRIESGLARRALDRLGLENRAGTLIWGHDRIGEALLRGQVALLLHAADARPDGVGKLEGRRRGTDESVPSRRLPLGRVALSQALGRENVVHAAITHRASAQRVLADLDRWVAFLGPNGPAAGQFDDVGAATDVAVVADERH